MKRFNTYLSKRISNLRDILNELDSTGQKYLICFSEDIGNADWWVSICDFLGISLNIQTSTQYVKLNPNHLDERVSNYPEMVRQLMYTKYSLLLFGDFFPDRENWLPDGISNEKNDKSKNQHALSFFEIHIANCLTVV